MLIFKKQIVKLTRLSTDSISFGAGSRWTLGLAFLALAVLFAVCPMHVNCRTLLEAWVQNSHAQLRGAPYSPLLWTTPLHFLAVAGALTSVLWPCNSLWLPSLCPCYTARSSAIWGQSLPEAVLAPRPLPQFCSPLVLSCLRLIPHPVCSCQQELWLEPLQHLWMSWRRA